MDGVRVVIQQRMWWVSSNKKVALENHQRDEMQALAIVIVIQLRMKICVKQRMPPPEFI